MRYANRKIILDNFNIALVGDVENKYLEVSYKAPLFLTYFGLLSNILLIIITLIFLFSKEFSFEIRYIPYLVVLLFFGLTSFYLTSIKSLFDKESGNLIVNFSGIYSTRLFATSKTELIGNIVKIGIRKQIRRYGDSFQVYLVLSANPFFSITGDNLKLSEAQTCAETIREFLGTKEKIEIID